MNRTMPVLPAAALALVVFLVFFAVRKVNAQDTPPTATFRHELFAGTPAENYLRYLQSVGTVPAYPWSSRAFSPRELRRLVPRDTAHPWQSRFGEATQNFSGFRYGIISPATALRYNTTFAYGSNDGPLWVGRGFTTALQLGFHASWGPVTLTIAPVAFRSENQAFDILANGRRGDAAFGNALFGGVDKPQRFGSSAYSQVDPGQSSLRIDLPFVSAGASTANMTWGPGFELPVLLGNNAAGFPHLFAGSSEPIDIFIGKLHGKVFWGELFQSEYSPVTGPSRYVSRGEPGTRRFATGLIVVGQPRGIPGLELGGARFFHSIWPRSGIPPSYFTKFFQGFLKKNIAPDRIADPRFEEGLDDRGVSDNQLVSVFGRWVLPRSGFEVHAEYGRDDHSYDKRDLLQEPDHARVYSFGARKVFRSRANALTAGRLEIMNFQLPQLSRYRGEGEIYVHGLIRQGHTNRGQMLGADVGVGTGAGSVFAVDRFTPVGRYTASWSRVVRQETGNYLEAGIRTPRATDVSHAIGFESSRFMRSFDLTGGLTLVHNFNRDFRGDATNLNALIGVRYMVR